MSNVVTEISGLESAVNGYHSAANPLPSRPLLQPAILERVVIFIWPVTLRVPIVVAKSIPYD